MRIWIAGPVETERLKKYLYLDGANLPIGDGGYSVVNLIIGLLERNHEVIVFSLSSNLDKPVCIQGERLKIYFVPLREKNRTKTFFINEINYLREAISKENPSFIHAHWSYEYAFASLFEKKTTLVTFKDNAYKIFLFDKNVFRFLRLLMSLWVLKKGNYISANSGYLKTYLEKFSKKKILLIPNIILNDSFQYKKRNIKDGYPNILMVNNGFTKWKNVKNAIIAFQLLRKSIPNAKLHLVGLDFEKNGIAHSWTIKNNVDKNVIFYGRIEKDKIIEYYFNNDIFLHTSLEESFGLVVAEAMATGLPVVGGIKSGAIPWLLDNGNCGLLCDVKKPQDICSVLNALISNKSLYLKISQNAFNYIFQNFSTSSLINIENIYSTIQYR